MSSHVILYNLLSLLTAVAAAGALPSFDKAVKIGRVGREATQIISSRTYIDRLYTVQNGDVLALDKDTSEVQATVPITYKRNHHETDALWDSISVGGCSFESDLDCVYLIKKMEKGAQLIRFREPEISAAGKAMISGDIESLSVSLSPSQSQYNNLHILVDSDSNVIIISREDNKYYGYKISAVHWKPDYPLTEFSDSRKEIKLQQDLQILAIDWNENEDLLLVLDSAGYTYMYNIEDGDSLDEALEGKPHLADIKLPKRHRLLSICWDSSVIGLYGISQGKHHRNLYRFNKAVPEVPTDGYQSDEAVSPSSSRSRQSSSRYSECTDSNVHCSTWAKNGMCEKRKSYMTSTCAKSCNTCQESMHMKAQPSSVCVDGSHLCSVWAGHGSCDSSASQDYMRQNCKKSCNSCSSTGGDNNKMCRDMHQYCNAWANAGRCESRPEYMSKNCPASCNSCNKSPASGAQSNTGGSEGESLQKDQAASSGCADRSEYCSSWADNGKCDERKDYMFSHCPDSCGLCGVKKQTDNKPGEQLQYESSSKCSDSSEYCLIWAAHGLCTAKTRYMSKYCPSACGKCQPRYQAVSGRVCEDSQEFCDTWAKYGMCDQKPAYMKENCGKSCGVCESSSNTGETISNRILSDNDGTRDAGSANHKDDALTETSGGVTRQEQEQEEATCVDSNQHCKVWADGGYCESRSEYMKVYCQASCKICTPSSAGGSQAGQYNREDGQTESGQGTNGHQGSDRDKDSHRGQGSDRSKETDRDQKSESNRDRGNDRHSESNRGSDHSSSQSSSGSTRVEVVDTTKSCEDTREHCSRWAEAGYCDSRTQVMHALCPLSCNVCGDHSQTAAATQAPTSTTTEDQRKTQGPTERPTERPTEKPVTTKVITARPDRRKNEGLSRQENGRCEDISEERCRIWQKVGQCEKSQYYMKANCARTCGHCPDSGSRTTSENSGPSSQQTDCKDKNKYCSLWARAKRCDLYAGYMKRNCAESCGHCGTSTNSDGNADKADCTDQYTNYCGTWAKKGYCSLRKEFMSTKCKKSCGLC